MNFKGVSKKVVKELETYVAQEELKVAHTPPETRDKVNAYLQGKENNPNVEIPYQVCSYIHYSSIESIYRPSKEDSNNLKVLMDLSKKYYPQNLCVINYAKFSLEDGTEKELLENFVVCTETIKNFTLVITMLS